MFTAGNSILVMPSNLKKKLNGKMNAGYIVNIFLLKENQRVVIQEYILSRCQRKVKNKDVNPSLTDNTEKSENKINAH